MEIGKLYQIKKYVWYLYPSKETAAKAERRHAAADALHSDPSEAAYYSELWSKQFNCNVTYISPNSIFCLIGNNGKLLKVLSTNGELGWMIYRKNEAWTKGCFEEVTQ